MALSSDTAASESVVPSALEYQSAPSLAQFNAHSTRDHWRTRTHCPICAQSALGPFATLRHVAYSRCRSCGFVGANPVPPDELLATFYNSAFYANYRVLEAARIASEQYYSISMYTDMARLAGWLTAPETSAVLDYGCGPGSFLAYLRDRHHFRRVEGLELSKVSVEFARRTYNLRVTETPEALSLPSYDYVLLLEVIEHIPEPSAFLRDVAKLVAPGGRLLLTTPAVDNLTARFFPSQCAHYTGPSHISLFTIASMTRLMTQHGFTIERLEIDRAYPSVERAALSMVTDLDFTSPQHAADASDALYVPNAIGRTLGLSSGRYQERGAIRRLMGSIDRRLESLWRRLPIPKADHLYLLARKAA